MSSHCYISLTRSLHIIAWKWLAGTDHLPFFHNSKYSILHDLFMCYFRMNESLQLRGTLAGHNGWVTQIATNRNFPDMILSASRGEWQPLSHMTSMFCIGCSPVCRHNELTKVILIFIIAPKLKIFHSFFPL